MELTSSLHPLSFAIPFINKSEAVVEFNYCFLVLATFHVPSPDVKVKRPLELQKNCSHSREIVDEGENADGETKSSINTNVSGDKSMCVSESL